MCEDLPLERVLAHCTCRLTSAPVCACLWPGLIAALTHNPTSRVLLQALATGGDTATVEQFLNVKPDADLISL